MLKFLTALLVACPLIGAARGQEGTRPVPKNVKLSLHIDREDYFLGENVLVHLCVENSGQEPFKIDLGGDYRGSTRHLRFKVLATDEQGKEVPDPDPFPMCMGGLGYSKEIKPGDQHFESLPLLRYRRFEKPGIYRLKVSHDFGWRETDESKRPTAFASIKFAMPDKKQARQIVDRMYQLPADNGGSAGKRREPFADFRTLIHPVYLPILTANAVASDSRALDAIAHMPSPEATKELIRLLDHKDEKFARAALKALNSRLPDPRLENKLGPRNVFEFDHLYQRRWLVERSWKPEFVAPVRKVGRELLQKKDADDLQCGAFILECLGTADDLPLLVKALDRAALMAKTMHEPNVYPRPRGACQELLRVARVMNQRAIPVNEKPASAGELILFACAIGSREKFRPAGWEKVLVRALKHPLPYVREVALDNLPVPPSTEVGRLLPGLIEDLDGDVQIAACHLAERWKAPHLRESVLKTLKTAKENWLFNAASNAALALGAFKERTEVLVSRLDEEGMTARSLSHLVNIIEDTNGYGSRTDLDVETGRACKKAWQQFLDRNADAVKAGKKFKLADRNLSLPELFPHYTFYPRQ